ncbi:unnamed protein product [Sphenostylis stenocarpa]|uniref:Uncharacterized protein n=1 Tax=Sphenostylis stenocarpa TaxID=92480 RepID=A0AA86SPY9_9FABA|nr:unnamed protein product [Sphenostylis stenocarpa]
MVHCPTAISVAIDGNSTNDIVESQAYLAECARCEGLGNAFCSLHTCAYAFHIEWGPILGSE